MCLSHEGFHTQPAEPKPATLHATCLVKLFKSSVTVTGCGVHLQMPQTPPQLPPLREPGLLLLLTARVAYAAKPT